ncbi:MAG: CerR family C-terminal domain-containing protein [Desulfobulbaceae bacterium]|nr:CerR family C-terminal domain-containing protein [Desulfobulbaceae bacterium]
MTKFKQTNKLQHTDSTCMATYETSIKTREALINAAGQLAAERGFASVSTRSIARRAGVNAGSIHYHFGGKEKLFAAVVQTVVQVWKDNPISELLKQYDTGTTLGQAQVIRAIVHRNIMLLFSRDLPDWYCRVIFQVMRNEGTLREIFKRELILPSHAAIKKLFRSINPAMDDREAFLRILIMNTPIFFHADRMDFILADLKKKRYEEKYLQKMEDIIVLQTQLSLGLPPC